MNKSEVERRTKEIVKELSIIDSFLEEGDICQPKWWLNMEYSLYGIVGFIKKSRTLKVPNGLHKRFDETITNYRTELIQELVELNKEATHDI
ncbi:hypothetical protein [Mogibacterium timidum]|uniref:Uncharacterized protein n=1 Tax=Mogibacterium timidum TaxID=35519 RepID=A0A7Y8VR87_9FIRM|nr:hypothetical protein [Mogibacterium timidum]NWO23143.1 hypothetical protein [Mogibacterium timidum]